MFANAGHRLLLTHALSNLGRIAARGGELDDARRLLNEALAIAEEIESASLVDEVKTRLAEWAVLARKTGGGARRRRGGARSDSRSRAADRSRTPSPIASAATPWSSSGGRTRR